MKNNTVYIAIMTHGSSEFNVKWDMNKEKHGSHTFSRSYHPSEVTIPEGVEYVQYITHAPLGTCNFSSSKSEKESLTNLEKHISELQVLDGKQLSEKLIELDREISPSIQDIDKGIKYYERWMNELKTLKPILTFSFYDHIREDKIRKFNKRIEGMEEIIRELQATKYISKKQGIYSYIEYDKTSPNAENMILSKIFQRDDKKTSGIHVIASKGGKLKPNFKKG